MVRDLAEKIVVALAPLRDAAPFAIAREALTLAAAFDAAWRIESERAAPSPSSPPSLADGEWRDAPKPAPYVPKVGDVVKWANLRPEYIVTRTSPQLGGKYISDGIALDWYGGDAPYDCTYLRPATPAERAAAGLPVDAPRSVDRVALAKVILNCGVLLNETGSFRVADAVIAFLNGGVA